MPHAVAISDKIDAVGDIWDLIAHDIVAEAVMELEGLNTPSEATLLSLLNSPSIV